MPTPTQPQECAFCGKKTAKDTKLVDIPYFGNYEGNERVVWSERACQSLKEWENRSGYVHHSWEDDEDFRQDMAKRTRRARIWDGEHYRRLRYGRFCTLHCGWSFAEYVLAQVEETEGPK